MAVSGMLSSNALCVKAWHEQLYRDTEKLLYWKKFEGEGDNNAVQILRELTKGPGDQITVGLVPRLTGGFVLGSSGLSMEGREQKITDYYFNLLLEEYKLAVRWKTGLDLQRPIYEMDAICRERLMMNLAENLDQLHFDAILSGMTRILAATSAASVGTMKTTAASAATAVSDATYKLTPTLIRQAKVIAQTGGAVASASDGSPARVFQPIRPLRVNGKDHYILLCHPNVGFDLGENSVYHQNLREAWKDTGNPIFEGGLAMVDGVIIHTHENMPIRSDGGAGAIVYAKCALLGAQSLVKGYGSYRKKGKLTENTTEVVAKEFGYDEEEGVCTKTIAKVQAPTFNSERYGSMGLFVACSNVSST